MPVRTGYTDSTYHMDTPWIADGRDSNTYHYGDSSSVFVSQKNLVFDYDYIGNSDSEYDKNVILPRPQILIKSPDAAAAAQSNADSANDLVATLRVQLANAESGGGGAIQTWGS